MRTRRTQPPVVREECPVCARKWGVSLWAGSCRCTNSIPIPFICPGPKSKGADAQGSLYRPKSNQKKK